MNIYVVDVQKIFNESKVGNEARKHISEVGAVLKKSLDHVAGLHMSEIGSPNSLNAIARSRDALQLQMNKEQAAADKIVRETVQTAVNKWRESQTEKVDMIVPLGALIFASLEMDITNEVMAIADTLTPKFPDLPKVTITPAPKQ